MGDSVSPQSPDQLLPGEDRAPLTRDEATHWLRVYVELIEFCEQSGMVKHALRERLVHWMHVYDRPAGPAIAEATSSGTTVRSRGLSTR